MFKLGFLPSEHLSFSSNLSLNSCLIRRDRKSLAGGNSTGKALNKILSECSCFSLGVVVTNCPDKRGVPVRIVEEIIIFLLL